MTKTRDIFSTQSIENLENQQDDLSTTADVTFNSITTASSINISASGIYMSTSVASAALAVGPSPVVMFRIDFGATPYYIKASKKA